MIDWAFELKWFCFFNLQLFEPAMNLYFEPKIKFSIGSNMISSTIWC